MSVSGTSTVALERIFFEVPDEVLVGQMRSFLVGPTMNAFSPLIEHCGVYVAPGATRSGVPAEHYHAYRRGLVSMCADVVLVAERDQEPKVALLKRAKPPFEGCSWIMGGAVFNFRSVQQFLLWKAHRECGLTDATIDDFVAQHHLTDVAYSCGDIHVIGCLGLYRTPAEDTSDPAQVCDTINLCHVALYKGSRAIRHDTDHTGACWASEQEILQGACGHWYPKRVALRAINIYRQAQAE